MSKKKSAGKAMSIVRSSAAEYLTFIAATGENETSVEMRYEDENIWLTQKMMAVLYDVTVSAINQHLKTIFGDNELQREATIKKYLIVQTEGSRQVQREVEHYNLQAIISGKVTAELAKAHAECEFEKFRIVQDKLYQSDFDRMLKQIGTIRKTEGTDE